MNEGGRHRSAEEGVPRERNRRRWILPLALLVIIWAVAFSHYPRLPRILPGYFQMGGDPGEWVPKGLGFFGLPLLAGAVCFILGVVGSLAGKKPSIMGQALHGRAAHNVSVMLRRFLWFMTCAILAFLLNVQFRALQIAYGGREELGWDSYLLGGVILGYAACGSFVLFRHSKRWLRWQQENESC